MGSVVSQYISDRIICPAMWGKMHNMHVFFELAPQKDKFSGFVVEPPWQKSIQVTNRQDCIKVHWKSRSSEKDNCETRTVAIEWSLGLRTFVLDSHQRDVFEWTLSNTRQHCMAGLGGCVCGDWEMIKGYKKGHIHFYTLIYIIVSSSV